MDEEILDELSDSKGKKPVMSQKTFLVYLTSGFLMYGIVRQSLSIADTLHEFQYFLDTPILVHFWIVIALKIILGFMIASYIVGAVIRDTEKMQFAVVVRYLIIFASVFAFNFILKYFIADWIDDSNSGRYTYWGKIHFKYDYHVIRILTELIVSSLIILIFLRRFRAVSGR